MKVLTICLFTVTVFLASGSTADADDTAVAQLIGELRSPEPRVRLKAAETASKMENVPDVLIEPLFELVLSKPVGEPREQIIASTAMHFADLALASTGKRSVPRLRELMKNSATRWTAVAILKRIGSDSIEAMPELILALSDRNKNVRSLAVNTLKSIGPDAALAVDALIPLLKDREENVREGAMDALAAIGPASAKAIPHLKKLLKPKYTPTAMRAQDTIDVIEGKK